MPLKNNIVMSYMMNKTKYLFTEASSMSVEFGK